MGAKYKGSKKEVNSLNTYIKLIRASETIRSKVIKSLLVFQITENQFNCLDAIFHLGPLSQKELGQKLFRSGGNITLVVDNLEKNRLVKRLSDKNDRRKFLIHLTQRGEQLYKKVFPYHLKLLVEELGYITEKDKKELQRICKKIGFKK
ncbi:MAG: MarR family transcriptional regulator [Bacteroidetes bacterium]|nr:MarR family transcriptional regulator [Bacteroidota bacterium]MCH8325353.1 MarR family transcriptional regulator [Bacteroidota bacterium]